MTDKTDASELAPETIDPDDVTRDRFAALRDRLLDTAEHYARGELALEQMVYVAQVVSGAASANMVVEAHSMQVLQEQNQALNEKNQSEVKEYMSSFVTMLQGMEQSNDERFKQHRAWVEQEMRARGLEPPKAAKVLSLVPDDGAPGPDAAG